MCRATAALFQQVYLINKDEEDIFAFAPFAASCIVDIVGYPGGISDNQFYHYNHIGRSVGSHSLLPDSAAVLGGVGPRAGRIQRQREPPRHVDRPLPQRAPDIARHTDADMHSGPGNHLDVVGHRADAGTLRPQHT